MTVIPHVLRQLVIDERDIIPVGVMSTSDLEKNKIDWQDSDYIYYFDEERVIVVYGEYTTPAGRWTLMDLNDPIAKVRKLIERDVYLFGKELEYGEQSL